MKRVLFVLEKFYPYNSANLNCLNPILDEMQSQNIQVDVLTFRQDNSCGNHQVINGINVFRVNDYYHLAKSKILKKTVLRVARKFLLKPIMVLNGKKLLKQNKYDCVIATSYPFFSEEIACGITKNTNASFISYQLDPFYNNSVLGEKNKDKRLKLETKVLKNADKVFLPHENYEENMECGLKVLKDKYYPIDFALIKEKTVAKPEPSDKIRFVFTGTFYKDIRTPYAMLDFFKKAYFDFNIDLYYIADESIEARLLQYQKEFDGKLNLYRGKTKDECDKALENANIILNIGNKISNQTPSKVFEYISMGKPVVNFHSIENDTSKRALAKYPLVINVFEKFTDKDVNDFKEFCVKNKDTVLSFDEVTKKYKTAFEIAQEFVEELEKCCANK